MNIAVHHFWGACYLCLPFPNPKAFGVDIKQSSWLSILPFLMMAIGTNASGWVADKLINNKVDTKCIPICIAEHPSPGQLSTPTKARKLLQSVGNIGPGICLLYLALSAKEKEVQRNYSCRIYPPPPPPTK